MTTTELRGRCHCGAIEIAFTTEVAVGALARRECACSFCRGHGAQTTTDPRGAATITVRAPEHLVRYRFGARTADFLLCGRCGVYVAAVATFDDGAFATLNTRTFDRRDELAAPTPVSYDGESADARRARRRARWTPTTLVLSP